MREPINNATMLRITPAYSYVGSYGDPHQMSWLGFTRVINRPHGSRAPHLWTPWCSSEPKYTPLAVDVLYENAPLVHPPMPRSQHICCRSPYSLPIKERAAWPQKLGMLLDHMFPIWVGGKTLLLAMGPWHGIWLDDVDGSVVEGSSAPTPTITSQAA